jgi:hypothetical protein
MSAADWEDLKEEFAESYSLVRKMGKLDWKP